MKKMIFSAVALVAFSFAGMANEIEEKKVEIKTIEMETVKTVDTESSNDCRLARFQAYVAASSVGFSHSEASGMSYSVYFMCLRLNSQF
jgi:uncharacterized lipoprotein NlpE involved in copper resistance